MKVKMRRVVALHDGVPPRAANSGTGCDVEAGVIFWCCWLHACQAPRPSCMNMILPAAEQLLRVGALAGRRCPGAPGPPGRASRMNSSACLVLRRLVLVAPACRPARSRHSCGTPEDLPDHREDVAERPALAGSVIALPTGSSSSMVFGGGYSRPCRAGPCGRTAPTGTGRRSGRHRHQLPFQTATRQALVGRWPASGTPDLVALQVVGEVLEERLDRVGRTGGSWRSPSRDAEQVGHVAGAEHGVELVGVGVAVLDAEVDGRAELGVDRVEVGVARQPGRRRAPQRGHRLDACRPCRASR